MLAAVVAAVLALAPTGTPAAAAEPSRPSPVTTAGRWLVDDTGRVVVTHGINVVSKVPPYTPSAMGFDAPDADLLAAEGFDSVRLGIIWKAVEPEPGRYDDAYLADVRETVRLLHSRGIRVLLDSHQDLYNEKFQGEFAPDWAVTVPWPAEPRLGFPSNQFFQPALMTQYDQFLANTPGPGGVGLLDRYAAMWGHVASFFAPEHVLGYDLVNEPWAGTGWAGCLTDWTCGWQKDGLRYLHTRAGAAIRAADPTTPVFYEPFSTSNPGASVHAPAPEVGGQALSFHSYCVPAIQFGVDLGCDAMDENTITRAQARADADRAPALLTEFGAKKSPATILPVVRASERRMVGWQYWAYCNCGDPTTSGSGEQGIVSDAADPDPTRTIDQAKLDAIVAPHPRAVAGTPTSFGYDPAAHRFTLSWTPERADGTGAFAPGALTEVSAPRRAYPAGATVRVDGGELVSNRDGTVVVRSTGTGPVTLTLTP